MELSTLAERMRAFIETELGLYIEVQHNGRGYSFYPVTTTGKIIGETKLIVNQTKNPTVFVESSGYFDSISGRAMASRFRTLLAVEAKPILVDDDAVTLHVLPEDFKPGLAEVLDFEKMAASLD